MTIKVGDKLPSVTLARMTADGPSQISTDDLTAGKKVVFFAVPGAFTPTCSAAHLPGFVKSAGDIKGKGVDAIACISVNDPFVMGAWGADQNVGDNVMMLADGSADFTKAVGMEFDLSGRGLGVRSQRYSMVVENGVVTAINLDEPGQFEVSSAEKILEGL